MGKKDLEAYEGRPDGYYCRGKRITNFICQLLSVIVDIRSGQRIFRMSIVVENRMEVTVEIPSQSLNSGSWLVDLPIPVWCNDPVSYTHLDVYKRQVQDCQPLPGRCLERRGHTTSLPDPVPSLYGSDRKERMVFGGGHSG